VAFHQQFGCKRRDDEDDCVAAAAYPKHPQDGTNNTARP